jgi:hypothetical protein
MYRLVDQTNPTLFIDEGDNIFVRKPELRSIFNAAWIKDKALVLRGGRWFNFWCPKAIGLLGTDMLPRTIASRGPNIKMVPPKKNEISEPFNHLDDDEFKIIRRKFLRWSRDNADAIAAIDPTYPEALQQQTCPKANWRLMLQIAQHAGDKWLKDAHQASLFLSRRAYAPSKGIEALAALKVLLKDKPWILSADAVTAMNADEHSPWRAFTSPGNTRPHPISVNEFAALLAKYDTPEGVPIQPHAIKAANNRRGYRAIQLKDAWERFADRIARVDVSWADNTQANSTQSDPLDKTSAPPLPPHNRRTRKPSHELFPAPNKEDHQNLRDDVGERIRRFRS